MCSNYFLDDNIQYSCCSRQQIHKWYHLRRCWIWIKLAIWCSDEIFQWCQCIPFPVRSLLLFQHCVLPTWGWIRWCGSINCSFLSYNRYWRIGEFTVPDDGAKNATWKSRSIYGDTNDCEYNSSWHNSPNILFSTSDSFISYAQFSFCFSSSNIVSATCRIIFDKKATKWLL